MTTPTGKFVWFELVTTAPAKAEAFYGEVLGWKTSSMSMGTESYTLINNRAAPIGGLIAAEGKSPSHWISYVAVDDVDAALARVTKAGGTVASPAFDVPTIGRMAEIADPQGARLFAYRAAPGDRAAPTGSGTFYWNELWTSDPDAAVRFYQALAGYGHEPMDMGPHGTYHVLNHGEVPLAGITKAPADAPTRWLPYVAVDDCDATADRAKRNGATVLAAPADIPTIGRFAILKDPTGAAFAIIKPTPM